MKFQTNVCPLCDKVLQLNMVAGLTFFSCPTRATGLEHDKSHYEVEFNKTHEVQRTIIFPYSIDTFSENSRSVVYRMIGQRWKRLTEVPTIRIETPEKLSERLDQLTFFS